MRKPDFFIVGAAKCGTTAMDHYLKQHPQIFMCRKDTHFFGADLHSKIPKITESKYVSFFTQAKNEKRLGETSVWYLYSKSAVSEIKNYSPDASIIIMLRNPVDMIWSLHSEMLYRSNENITNFEEALEAEKDRKKGLRIPSIAHRVEGLYYRDVIKYTEQLQRYLTIFGSENIYIIIYDDFKNNTPLIYEDTLRFLGVDTDYQPDFRVMNANKTMRNKSLARFLVILPRFALRLQMSVLPSPVRRGLVHLHQLLLKANTRYEKRPAMDPALRRRLQAEFAVEVEKLSVLLNRDLTYWSR